MPTYIYRCEDCGHARDLLKRMSERDLPSVCPEWRAVSSAAVLASPIRPTGGARSEEQRAPAAFRVEGLSSHISIENNFVIRQPVGVSIAPSANVDVKGNTFGKSVKAPVRFED
jgi:putative FmdB family regulatory protein